MKFEENREESPSESEESDGNYEEGLINFPDAPRITEKLVKEDTYILGITATSFSSPTVAVATSDDSVSVYNFDEEFREFCTIKPKSDKLVSLQFSRNDNNLLWVASYNGCIDLWDIRTPNKTVSKFTDTTDDKTEKDRKFNCFDVCSNGRLLCAGTDDFEGDCFMLFWDIRNFKLLGGFWESHTKDITQVIFHPSDPNKMLSGSTDGLINIYDLTQCEEYDALVDSLNTESSVEKVKWSEMGSRNIISCTTHTSDVQLWKQEDVQPYCDFKRVDIANNLQKKEEFVYVTDVHVNSRNSMILAGSNRKNGEYVCGLRVEGSKLIPAFRLLENRQRIRCSWYNENTHLLLTGGEKSYLNAWKLDGNVI